MYDEMAAMYFPKNVLPLSDNFRQHSISQTVPIPNTLSKGSGGQTSGHKLYHLHFPFTFTKWCHKENVILVFTVLIGFTFGGCMSKNGGVWPHTSCCFQCEADQRGRSIGNFFFVFIFSTFTFLFHFLLTLVFVSNVKLSTEKDYIIHFSINHGPRTLGKGV